MSFQRLIVIFLLIGFLPSLGVGQSLQLADSLYQTGRRYDKRGNMEQSEFYYQQAFNIYKGFKDTASWLKAGKEYASAMVYRSKNNQAMGLYKALLETQHPANDTYNRADILNSMGWSNSRLGRVDKALTYYQRSLPLAKKTGDKLLLGIVYDNIGSVHTKQGNYSGGLKFSKKALPYFKKLGNKRSLSTTIANIASVYENLSLYSKALKQYNKALKIRKKIGSDLLLAYSYGAIGGLQSNIGNYDQALISFNKSLEYARKTGSPSQTSTTLNNIGLLYKRLGEYDKALDYYKKSLIIKQDKGDPGSIASTTSNLGQLLWAQEKYEEAEHYFRKALEIRKKRGNPYQIYYSLNTMARMHLGNKNYEQAKNFADQIKIIGDTTDSYNIQKTAATYLGKIAGKKGHNKSAMKYFNKAYAYSKYLSPVEQLVPLKNLANQYNKINSDSAIAYGEEAISIIEQQRANAGSQSNLKSSYFSRHSDFYKEVASWQLTYNQNIDEAYRLTEQTKARSLNDELAKASQNIGQHLPEDIRVKRRQKRNRIDALYTDLESMADKNKRAEIQEKINKAELNYSAYENNIKKEYPELKSFTSPKPISLNRAQELTGEQTAVLEYAVSEHKLIIFLITSNGAEVKQIPFSGDESLHKKLTSLVGKFKQAILSNASQRQLRKQSSELYISLIKPYEKRLTDFNNLIIVPDGALAYLPFEALSRGGQYLVEKYNIKYEPSLTSLSKLEEPKQMKRKDLLAVAGSETEGQNNQPFSALPSTIIEVDSIAKKFQNSAILKDAEVSEQRVKSTLRDNKYKYIHLATHSIIDENHPARSGLALSSTSDKSASSREDGMLRKSEIFGLNLNSNMVVLSACNTGLGKVVKGEGMLGMQRSFFYAGTSTVVVSLWNVYDRSTATFMNQFYQNIIKSKSRQGWTDQFQRWIGWDESIPFGKRARAMRQAKLKMIDHPLFSHPVYWAPFIVVGR